MMFGEALQKVMPYVDSGSKEPFIVYRDKDGGLQCNFTQNQYGNEYDWVEDAKAQDPLAVTFTGADFDGASFPGVFDKVLTTRMRSEFDYMDLSGQKKADYAALLSFIEDNITELSPEAANYITQYERPLFQIEQMLPFSLHMENAPHGYNEDMANAALEIIESKIQNMISRPIDEPHGIDTQKRVIDGYEEITSLQVNGRLMFIGENHEAEHPYMVSELKWDNPFGVMESRFTGITGDYVEALDKYSNLVEYNIGVIKSDQDLRKNMFGVEPLTLTADHCIPNGLKEDLTGKLIVVKADVLSRECRRADYQLRVCTGGFGASPKASGRAVFCTELFYDKNSRFERQDILGVADIEKLPQWAVDRLSEFTKANEQAEQTANDRNIPPTETTPPDKQDISAAPSKKKQTLQEKLDNAKQKAATQDSGKSTPGKAKKRDNNNNGRD